MHSHPHNMSAKPPYASGRNPTANHGLRPRLAPEVFLNYLSAPAVTFFFS